VTNRLTRLFKEPLIQFLIIGAGIYGAYAWLGTPEQDYRDTIIRVDSSRINAMISSWESRWKRLPTRQEIDGLIQSFIREDVLYRQAVTMGLNEDDPVTRRRMAQKLEFLTSDLALLREPAEGELEQFFQENLDTYGEDDLISFSQIFFNPDQRGSATVDDAAEILAQLQGEPDEKALGLGDRIMLQEHFSSATEFDIRRLLGNEFSKAVMTLEPGQWHGPVYSGFGVHLVYVYNFQKAPAVEFESVKTRVLDDWRAEISKEFNEQFLEGLKDRYEIVIDELPADRLLDGQTEVSQDDPKVVDSGPMTDSGQ
jgi:hypothetical protein